MATEVDQLLTSIVDVFGPVIGCQVHETVQDEIANLTPTDLTALQAQIDSIKDKADDMQGFIDIIDAILDGNDTAEQSPVVNIISMIQANSVAITNLTLRVTTNEVDIEALKNGDYDGADGKSYYDVWIEAGNSGSVADMISAHKGDTGDAGASAYQTWLANGNSGTAVDFLASLKGETGEVGATGASAYQTWLANGNSGTNADFLASLVGTNGSSAYELWLANGGSGSESDYLASLVGADGQDGQDGDSAYQVWLAAGNSGTAADFLASLKGTDADVSQFYNKGEVDAIADTKVDKADVVTAATTTVVDLAARLKAAMAFGIAQSKAGACPPGAYVPPAPVAADDDL